MSVEMPPPAQPERDKLREGSYVDWACVIAGAVFAAALSGLLLTFGSGVGLSMVSPFSGGTNFSVTTLVAITAAWTILVYIGSYAAGGYIAGRMRRPWSDANDNELTFRDGVHGLLVWAVGVIVSAMVVASSAGSAVTTATTLGGAAATLDYAVDTLLRPAPGAAAPQQTVGTDRTVVRDEARRLLAAVGTSVAGGRTAQGTAAQGGQATGGPGQAGQGGVQTAINDRTYLVQLVANNTGLSTQQAEQRVTQVVERARAATEQARRVGIIAAFLTAASLLVAAVAAWYAATSGGEHRERGTLWRGLVFRGPRSGTTA